MRNTFDRSSLPRPRILPQVQEEEDAEDPDAYVDEELEEEDVASEQTSARVQSPSALTLRCHRMILDHANRLPGLCAPCCSLG